MAGAIPLAFGLLASIAALVIGSRLVVERGRTIGIYFDLSPYLIGVFVVAIGTSLPELAANIAAALHDYTSLPIAKAVGANITNVLLVGGAGALLARSFTINEDLSKTELPFFIIALAFFLGTVADRTVTLLEGALLCVVYGIYAGHLLFTRDLSSAGPVEEQETIHTIEERRATGFPRFSVFLWFTIGIILVVKGADFTVAFVTQLAQILDVSPAAIALVALSLGTSLPELVVSTRAAITGESALAFGNIIGSNTFNLLGTVGIPALIAPLTVAPVVWWIGIPVLIATSVVLLLLGYARAWYRWEGSILLVGYLLFLLMVAQYASAAGTTAASVFGG